jgi:hypothetical protein
VGESEVNNRRQTQGILTACFRSANGIKRCRQWQGLDLQNPPWLATYILWYVRVEQSVLLLAARSCRPIAFFRPGREARKYNAWLRVMLFTRFWTGSPSVSPLLQDRWVDHLRRELGRCIHGAHRLQVEIKFHLYVAHSWLMA